MAAPRMAWHALRGAIVYGPVVRKLLYFSVICEKIVIAKVYKDLWLLQ